MKNLFNKGIVLVLLAVMMIHQSCHDGSSEGSEGKSPGKLKGTISISGAFALYPLTVKWAEEFQKIHPKVRIDISAGGAGKGMTDALSGMVDLGMFSRGITDAEKEKGCWWIAVTKDAVLPTINARNPWLEKIRKTGISLEEFRKIYITNEITKWSELFDINDDKQINVYTRSDACGAAQMWGEYLGYDQESLHGIGVFGDPGMADAVKNDIYSLGFNNVIYVYDQTTRKFYQNLEVMPIDLNDNGEISDDEYFYATHDEIMNAIKAGIYPSPPARDLYFVSKGKPETRLVAEFLKWILTDGQKYVEEAGYVQLSTEKIEGELQKIKSK